MVRKAVVLSLLVAFAFAGSVSAKGISVSKGISVAKGIHVNK